MSKDGKPDVAITGADPSAGTTALIRELVTLSQFTEGILRTLGSAVVLVDVHGRVAYVNPAAESLLQRPAVELLQQPADQVLLTRDGSPLVGDTVDPARASGETDLLLPGGGSVTADVRLSQHRDEENREGGIVAILTDRTEIKRAEQLSRRKERLASLGELSAGVAHEIRNPLAGIGASAQLLRSRLGEFPRHIRLTEVILEEVERLDRIVESLLRFARPPEPQLRESCLADCFDRALELVRSDASAAGIVVETEYAAGLPTVWLDSDQIQQVALNLFRNAVQSMDAGGTLRVAVRRIQRRPYVRHRAGRRQEDAGLPNGQAPRLPWLQAEVSDTGCGIAEDTLDRVFNPFFTTKRTGTGLGLSISQTIIQEHGGTLAIESALGRGTRATLELPVEKRRGRRRTHDPRRDTP